MEFITELRFSSWKLPFAKLSPTVFLPILTYVCVRELFYKPEDV